MRIYQYGLLFFLALISSKLTAQSSFQAALLPTKEGGVIAYTNEEKGFTITLKADSLRPTEKPGYVLVDDWVLQSFILEFENPKAKDLSEEANAKASLSEYLQYELAYFKNELKLEVTPSIEWGDLNGRYFYFWYFDTPEALKQLDKQLFLTTICHNQYLNLNIPLFKGKDFEEAKAYLFEVGQSIELYNHPIDVEELFNRLNH